MLSQEELDKLLSEGQDGDDSSDASSSDAAPQENEQADDGSDASSQDEDISWDDAFKEAAQGGDPAAQKAMEEGRLEEVKEEDAQSQAATPPPPPPPSSSPQPDASAPSFSDFGKDEQPSKIEHPDLDFILDIPLDVSVELGRTKLRIKDLLQLGQGSVVELNKLAGEPAEIYVNQKLMAKGEIVVVNEKFGVRLTEIISPSDRVKSLG